MFKAVNNRTVNFNTLSEAVILKLRFLESDFIKQYCSYVAGETYKPNKENLQQLYVSELENSLVKRGKLKISHLLEILNSIVFSAKAVILKQFVQSFIIEIEKKIEATKAQRKANPLKASEFGKQLAIESKEGLSQINSILGARDLKYASIADKVADEVLQCGIEYFNKYKDHDTVNPGYESMNCLKLAKSIAVGSIITQRCNENIEGLQEWINDKPERDKQKRIINDLEKLKNIIDLYEQKSDTINNAGQLLASAKPLLTNIKNVLGSTDDLYLGLSSRIASDSQQMLITEINSIQKTISQTPYPDQKRAGLIHLKQKVEEAWVVTITIGNMDLVTEFRSRYNANRLALSNLRTQLSQVGSSGGRSSSSSGSGCYIATMVYGNYEHPQVIILRNFRDYHLSQSLFGRNFIKFYYKHSPVWVEYLKNKPRTNKIIRILLDSLIKLLKND